MTMKKTELEKRAGLQIAHRLKHAAATARRSDLVASAAVDRRARREADRAAGRVPFAVKLPQALVARLQQIAGERGVTVDQLVAPLLEQALPAIAIASRITSGRCAL